jgi:hypothetical protein
MTSSAISLPPRMAALTLPFSRVERRLVVDCLAAAMRISLLKFSAPVEDARRSPSQFNSAPHPYSTSVEVSPHQRKLAPDEASIAASPGMWPSSATDTQINPP